MAEPANGTWPQRCVQRAFVEGAAWWKFTHGDRWTMFGSERDEAEAEAIHRYGPVPEHPPQVGE